MFGWIETVGGVLKILIVVGGGIVMYVLNHEGGYFGCPDVLHLISSLDDIGSKCKTTIDSPT